MFEPTAHVLVGPLSPTVQVGSMSYTSPLNPLACLGDYQQHPRIHPFFASPEALAGVVPAIARADADAQPHCFKPGKEGLLQPLIDHYTARHPVDYVLWWGLHYGLPLDLQTLKLPCVLMVSDWHDHYLALRPLLQAFDLIFCDEKLRRKLVQDPVLKSRVHYGAAYSFDPTKIPPPAPGRDIDVLFVGGHNPRKYISRNQYLFHLAGLPHLRTVFASDVSHEYYLQLLSRSKIAFNHALRQEMNLRSYEAAACGALLFVEDTNLEVAQVLTPEVSYVPYQAHNLAERLRYYLDHETQRARIAAVAQETIQAFSYTQQFSALLQQISEHLPTGPKPDRHRDLSVALMALLNTTTVPAWRRFALTRLHEALAVKPVTLALYNAALVTTTDVTLFLADPPPITQPLKTLQQGLYQAYCQQRSALVNGWLYVYNLAWSHYLSGDHEALAERLAEVWQDLKTADFQAFLADEQSAFVLPLRYTGLHLFYQEAAYERAALLQQQIHGGAHFLQGCWFKSQGDDARAQQAFQACIQQTPHFAEAYFELATLFLIQHRALQAEQCLRTGLLQGVFFPKMWRFYFEVLAQRELSASELQATEQLVVTLGKLFNHPKYQHFMLEIQQGLQQLRHRSRP